MSYPTPPKGWEMVTGTWGTDAERSETVVQSDSYSINLKDTAVATKMRGPWFPTFDGVYYNLAAAVQTDDITAGNTITVKVEQYEADRVTLVTTDTIATVLPAAANTWQWMGRAYVTPATNARWMRVTVEKAAVAFNAYIDAVVLDRAPPFWAMERITSVQSIPASTWTQVAYNSTAESNLCAPNTTTGALVFDAPGTYHVTASAEFDSLADGTTVAIRFKSVGTATIYRYGAMMVTGGAGDVRITGSATFTVLAALESLTVEVFQSDAGARNINVGATSGGTQNRITSFMGHRVASYL